MKISVTLSRTGIVATLAITGIAGGGATQAKADMVLEQYINLNAVQNVLWSAKAPLQRWGMAPGSGTGVAAFSGERSEFDSRHPFEQSVWHAFDALGYAKAPPMAAAPPPTWLYGVNVIGAIDETRSGGVGTSAPSGTVAVDVTKIGIFTTSDALTFVATGTGIWAHTFGLDINTSAGAGTLAYTNGGFSADFTTSATWSRPSALNGGVAPAASSSISYTGNAQYKYDLPYKFYIEPTIGVTYTELYTANFGTKTGDSTEFHAGARIGTEMMWMTYKIQPQIAGQVFKNVSQSGILAGAVPGLPVALVSTDAGLGARGSGRINVIWTPNFSSFLDVHGMGLAGMKTAGFVATQTIGGSAGIRYSW
ncbi:hypothetical protein SAMN05444050_0933 [Afipia sp. GAS231]|nr:hypothetical protein SAMN05444050_0933 [Afipia sp. GAS231]